ncbi:coiled-coil domain-containing protein 9 [Acanthochromis polyacanthus]|uniref:coiled-coil domain-containing protein 9 n=1 Tax=Acanthochromis polyacanthus TaxID=80966 RepID=UPI002234615E|nr:coiled-coil domain-containing protein 9 [Acanthochromis polyacanthus]
MSSAVDLKTKEEKDAELDRRIEALRKKNEALVKRYQEIEEDKKKAEQEGIAVTTPRKPRPHEPETDRRKTEKENFTVTVDLSKPAGEKRVVNDWKPGTPRGRKSSEESDSHRGQSDGRSPPRRTGSGRVGRGGGGGGGRQERREWEPRTPRDGEPGEAGGPGRRGGRRGRGGGGGEGTPGGMDRKSKEWEEKRRQNIEKMNEEMERIAEYERGQRVDGDKPIRNFLDDPRRSGPAPDVDRKEGSRRHVRNWGGLDFDNVKTGAELEKEWTSRRPGPKGSVDMTMSMTGRERAEYLRWKKEREQIDEERLARHRNATGQWRREWDAQKTDNMFKEDPYVAAEGVASEQGSRRARGRTSRTEPRGRASDDSKRPPKAPTFGDFLSQGRSQGPRGDRSRGKGRGQKPSYSMHDNRWEAEKEEEEKEKEDKTKREEKTKKTEKEDDKPKPAAAQKVEEKNGDGEEDEDEWEDASDGEDEGSDLEHDSRGDEKKDTGKEKRAESKDSSTASPKHRSRPTSAGSPKEQRTPRPKVHIPPPAAAQDSPEGGKPLSPFSPLDGHQPVSDWGEEMEMQSPRSSMGGESPLKPPSAESSPPQKKNQEEENQAGSSSEPQKEETASDVSSPPETLQKEPEPDSQALAPSDSAPCEVSDSAPFFEASSEAAETMYQEQETPAAPSQAASPPPAVLEAEQSSSEPAAEKDDDDGPTAEPEQTSSG